MTIEEWTPDEMIENLKALQDATPIMILFIKMNQRADPVEADPVEADPVEGSTIEAPVASNEIFIE